MAHKLAHTVVRGGNYYYNRRVPKSIAPDFGQHCIRVSLGGDAEKAEHLSTALTDKLTEIWAAQTVKPVCINKLLEALEPKALDLLACADMYLSERDIDPKPVRLAVAACAIEAGNKDIRTYTRSDARRLVEALLAKGNKSATVRRRLQSLHAIIELGFHELDETKRNPFSRLTIPHEGKDVTRRGVFSSDQLASLYARALASGKDTRLILPVLGETGARLAEIVGLRWEDVCLEQGIVRIVPHPLRRLKTPASEREVPLVGAAFKAMRKLHGLSGDQSYVFPRWLKETGFVATHASNTLNKHIRQSCLGLTCHCFRHTIRDRLRNAGAPMELIDGIGGWSSVGGVGTKYGLGYDLESKREQLAKVSIAV